ncbi:MAG TPA: C1 family peptidase [Actinomycetota bacterium]|nr:C1 family peptidase [Actinomycetota bacterium]
MARKKRQPRRILNCIPSRETQKDWRFRAAAEAGVVDAAAAIPSTRNLREDWWRIGDQGSTGSCVGWATADSVLRWHLVKVGRIGKEDRLSVRFQWMASKETDQFRTRPTAFIETEGTSLKSALDVARKFGAVRDTVLAFGSGKLYQDEGDTFYSLASALKIGGYFNLGRDLDDWRTWLATKGPIITRLDVDRTWYEATDNAGKLDAYRPETARGGHAVALVGYTTNRFVVRNSWGTDWGDDGFAYASHPYALAAFTEAYGVSL